MKLLLYKKHNALDMELKARYLDRMEVDYFVYLYNQRENRYERRPYLDAELLFAHPEDFISLEDKGESFEASETNPMFIKNAFMPDIEEMRYDDELIAMVEESPDLYTMEVFDIEPGTVYKIIESHDGYEDLMIDNADEWRVAG